MNFTWRPKGNIGKLIVTLLIAGPFGYLGVTLLGNVRSRLAGFALLGVALLMVGALVGQTIWQSIARRQRAPQRSRCIRHLEAVGAFLPGVAVVAGAAAFGVVFSLNRVWMPALFSFGGAGALMILLIWRAVRPTPRPAHPQTVRPRPNPRMIAITDIKPLVWALIGTTVGVATLSQLVTSAWAPALVLAMLAVVICTVAGFAFVTHRLGQRMRAPLPNAMDSLPAVPAQAASSDSPPLNSPSLPFTVRVFDLAHAPPADAATQEVLAQRLRSMATSALVYRRGANQLWCWLVGMLLFVLLGNGSVRPYDFGLFTIGCIYHAVILVIPRKKSEELFWVGSCLLVNGAWLLSVVFVAAFSAVRLLQSAVGLEAVLFATIMHGTRLDPLHLVRIGWAIFTNSVVLVLGVASLIRYRHQMQRESAEHARSLPTDRPLKLLFLWVFGSDAVMSTLMTNIGGQWGMLGSMQVLCGRGYMGAINEVLPALWNKQRDPLVKSPAELEDKLRSFNHSPAWHGRYATNSLLCHDSVWRAALDALLADTQVVVMSLGGFSAENSGCVYEVGQLIDHIPTERFLLLVDDHTDMEALNTTLAAAWAAMRADSPNRVAGATLQLYHTRWFAVAPVRGDPDTPLTAEQAAFEELRAQSVQREVEHVVALLYAGAVGRARLPHTDAPPPVQFTTREP